MTRPADEADVNEKRRGYGNDRKSIDVHVPVSTAYDQWTQFEEFPRFMEGVAAVKQIDDSHIRWIVEVGGEQEEWEAEIVEQQPDRLIAWRVENRDVPTGAWRGEIRSGDVVEDDPTR